MSDISLSKHNNMSKEYLFHVEIRCIACVQSIEETLSVFKKIKIKKFNTNLLNKILTVEVDDTEQSSPENIRELITEALEDIGLHSKAILPIEKQDTPAEIKRKIQEDARQEKRVLYLHLVQGLVGLALGALVLTLSLLGLGLPLFALILIGAASALVTLLIGYRHYVDAFKKLIKAKTLTMDMLFTVSTLSALLVSMIAFFVPGLPMMFEAGLLIFGFRHIGVFIEESAKKKVLSGLSFRERLPQKIEKIAENTVILIDVAEVMVGDVVMVKKGEVIPFDGICLNAGEIYQTILTGNTFAQPCQPDQAVLAGMRVSEATGDLKIRVRKKASESYLAWLDQKIKEAESEKAPLEITAMNALKIFIPAVLALALIVGVVVGVLFPPALAIQCVIAILVAACPCVLGFIVPLSVRLGMVKAAEKGAVVTSGKCLQAAAQVDEVVFDLNGTLTTGEWHVENIVQHTHTETRGEVLSVLHAIECASAHPIAKTLVEYIKKTPGVNLSLLAEEKDEQDHAGIRAKIQGEWFVVGNRTMMQTSGVILDEKGVSSKGPHQCIYLAKGTHLIATIVLQDAIRPDAKYVIQQLSAFGKTVHICTGADEQTAQYYAALLGVLPQHVCAECVPAMREENEVVRSKLNYIRALQAKQKKVAMVGDAGNDAIALTKSEVGIAMKSTASDEVTLRQAGIIVDDASLMPVLTAMVVAKKTVNNIKQNLFFSLSYNMAIMSVMIILALVVGVAVNPGVGVALMILQVGLVLLNAYRFKRSAMPHLQSNVSHEETATSSYSTLTETLDAVPQPDRACTPLLSHEEEKVEPLKAQCVLSGSESQQHQVGIAYVKSVRA